MPPLADKGYQLFRPGVSGDTPGMAASAPRPASRWLYGPLPDLLLGCGLWYFLAFAVLALYGSQIRLSGGLIWAPILMLIFGVPHHGATLLRVYENRSTRRAYALFSVWASLLVWGVFAVGVYSSWVGSWLLTVFLTWSPWHYTGQNYGIAVLFLRRNQVAFSPLAKRCLHASFVLSYLLTFVVMHHGGSGSSYSAVPYDLSGYRFLSLDLPLDRELFLGIGAAYLGSLLASAILLLRSAGPRALAPTACLVVSQALWFSIPVAVRSFGLGSGLEVIDSHPEYYFLWIGVAHAVQYLWVTSYYARASRDWPGPASYFAKAALAGALAWTLPSLLFAPDLLGRLPFDAGLAALIAATVNLQHFILDGAIWKLRDGRVARVLIRSAPEEEDQELRAGSPWPGRLTWALGALCVAVMSLHVWESYSVRRAVSRGPVDVARLERSLERLSWVGRDDPSQRVAVARAWLRRDRPERALPLLERAIELQPSASAWQGVGDVRVQLRDWQGALAAYEEALRLEPRDPRLHHASALVWLERDQPERARSALEEALRVDPAHEKSRLLLRRLERQAAEPPEVRLRTSALP